MNEQINEEISELIKKIKATEIKEKGKFEKELMELLVRTCSRREIADLWVKTFGNNRWKKFYVHVAKYLKEKRIREINLGSVKVDILEPSVETIRCFDINEDFVLQPTFAPIVLTSQDKDGKETKVRRVIPILLISTFDGIRNIFPLLGMEIEIEGKKFILSALPADIPSLPSKGFIKRFLNGEKVDSREIWNEIKLLVGRFLDLEDNRGYISYVTWIFGTYFFLLFDAFPYPNFYGLKESGKSRALDILGKLCFHALPTGVLRKIPALYRMTERMGCTVLKDEAQKLVGKNADEELKEFFLTGNRRGSMVPLVGEGFGKERPIEMYETYSPKAIASTIDLWQLMGTRLVLYYMLRTADAEIGKRELSEGEKDTNKLRDQLYMLRLQDGCQVAEFVKSASIDDLLEGRDIELLSRDREVWFPHLVLAKLYGSEEEYEELVRYIAQYQQELLTESIESSQSIVLSALYETIKENATNVSNENEIWTNINDVRKRIIFSDPEAYKVKYRDGVEECEIIRTSDTAKTFTGRRIGAVLDKLGFRKKRKSMGYYQRAVSLKKVEETARRLGIKIEEENV